MNPGQGPPRRWPGPDQGGLGCRVGAPGCILGILPESHAPPAPPRPRGCPREALAWVGTGRRRREGTWAQATRRKSRESSRNNNRDCPPASPTRRRTKSALGFLFANGFGGQTWQCWGLLPAQCSGDPTLVLQLCTLSPACFLALCKCTCQAESCWLLFPDSARDSHHPVVTSDKRGVG